MAELGLVRAPGLDKEYLSSWVLLLNINIILKTMSEISILRISRCIMNHDILLKELHVSLGEEVLH